MTLSSIIVLLAALFAFGGSEPKVRRCTIDGGGVMFSTGGSLELSGTIGQPDAGRMSSGELQLSGGFWFSIVPGDCNVDGGIGHSDFTDFSKCKSGPEGGVDSSCQCLDYDADGDVDLRDFASLGNQFTGD